MFNPRPTLALTVRSLREDTRLLRVHVVRLLFVAGMLWLVFVAQEQSRWIGAPGLSLFEQVCYLDLVVLTLVGIGYFTSAITEEKEEQTIGLLTMADIGPTAMLVGKMLPRLFGAMLILLAQIPFTLLAVTLGGVLPHQIVAAYATLLAYLVLMAGLGLFFSVVCRTTLAASRAVVIAVVAALFLPWFIGSLPFGGIPFVLREASPFFRIGAICQTGFSDSAIGFQVIVNSILGAILFVLSRVLFRRFVHDEPGGPTRSLFDTLGRRTRGSRGSTGLRPRRAWREALVWKDFYFIAGGFRMMVVKLIAYSAAIVGIVVWITMVARGVVGGNYLREFIGGTFMTVMAFAVPLEMAVMASRLFSEEIRWQTLPTLAMLPPPITTSAFSKALGCLLGLAPALALFGFGVLIYPDGLGEFLEESLDEPGFWWFASQVVLFIHLTAYFSLFTRWGSMPLAFGVIFLANACCISTVALSGGPSGGAEEVLFVMLTLATGGVILTLYFLIGERLKSLLAR